MLLLASVWVWVVSVRRVPQPVISPDDTVGDLKKLVAAQTGTRPDKIVLKKW